MKKGMHMAATAAFFGCSHVLCMKHINEKIQHCPQEIGVPKIIRQEIKTLVYILVDSSDEPDFSFKKKLFEYCEIKRPTSIQYVKSVIYPKIKNHVWKPKQKIGFVWTNNLFIHLIFYISIFILLTRKKATEALICRVRNYPDLLPKMPRYCCPLVI